MSNDLDLALALLRNLDGLPEVADAALNLDLLVQELLKGRDIEDLVAGRLRSVDDELCGQLVNNSKQAQSAVGTHLLRHLGALLGANLLLLSRRN